jgi:hypothetical protein
MMLQDYFAGFDREAPGIGKPLMRIPNLILYFHANSSFKTEMRRTDGKG